MHPRRIPTASLRLPIPLAALLVATFTGGLSCATRPTAQPNGPGSAAIPDVTRKLGLQLFSVRTLLEADVPGTLNRVREMGFHLVEVHKTMGLSYANFRSAAATAQLGIPSMMSPFDRLRDHLPEVIADAKAMGVQFIRVRGSPTKISSTAKTRRARLPSFASLEWRSRRRECASSTTYMGTNCGSGRWAKPSLTR